MWLRHASRSDLEGDPSAKKRLVEPDGPELERAGRQRLAPLAEHQLGAAAPDVADEQPLVEHGQGGEHAQVDEAGLLPAGDDLDLDPGLAPGPVEEAVVVLRLADGGGGHAPQLGAVGVGQATEATQHLDAPLHRRGREVLHVAGPLAQADLLLLPGDDLEAIVVDGPGHHQVERVGPDVDGGEPSAMGRTYRPTSSPRSGPRLDRAGPAGHGGRPGWQRLPATGPRRHTRLLSPAMTTERQVPDRNLAMELVRVTEAAAMAAARWMGRGDKEGADGAAVDAMRLVLGTVPMDGIVIIGEGEKDEAPMLYNGERIGDGTPPRPTSPSTRSTAPPSPPRAGATPSRSSPCPSGAPCSTPARASTWRRSPSAPRPPASSTSPPR